MADAYADFKKKIDKFYGAESARIWDVFRFARAAHEGQKRSSGEEYFTHPASVAETLCDLGMDAAAVSAALLHDVLEDTPHTREEITALFGEETAALVAGVTKLDRLQFKSAEEEQAENIRKMLLAMAGDIRVMMIKLADRLHNMRTLAYLPRERQVAMAAETRDIYAPLAGRLGLSYVKCELEDLAFKFLEPAEYEEIVQSVAQKREERQEFVERVIAELNQVIKELGVAGEISGRPKHFYSIYRKMKKQGKSFGQIFDLTAVRVIVKTVSECYAVLGAIHGKWKPFPGRVKDYIAAPKSNLYQSLHTTVLTDFGQAFEIQIRTADMHRVAEYGIAAHWKYKEGKTDKVGADLKWLSGVAAINADSSKEFLETVKEEIAPPGEIYVFSPKGDIIPLPVDAVPADFAYAIHSEVGNRCTGARVNGKMVPLTTVLNNGDAVEIITSANSKGPSRDWLKIVKSSAARSKIKQFFKRELKEEYIKTGKIMLEEAAKSKSLPAPPLSEPAALDILYARYSVSTPEELYAGIGFGSIGLNGVLNRLTDYYKKYAAPPLVKPVSEKIRKNRGQSIVVKGVDDLLIRFAKCCNPLPGDEIVGFISRGRGVTVHRGDCPSLSDFDPARLIREIEWAGTSGGFTGILHITARDRNGLVAEITKIVNNLKFTITALAARTPRTGLAEITLELAVTRLSDLNAVVEKLKAYEPVIRVSR